MLGVFRVLLSVACLFFLYMALKGILNPFGESRFDSYVAMMLIFATICAGIPLRHAMFEWKLAAAAEKLIARDNIAVTCLSRFGGLWHWNAAGYVYRGSQEINLQGYVCEDLRDYLWDPGKANAQAINDTKLVFALHVMTHETMHVDDIYDEIRADCRAFQLNHKMAELLGVETRLAAQSAIVAHRFRSKRHPYYSPHCEPGGALDEKIPAAVWMAG